MNRKTLTIKHWSDVKLLFFYQVEQMKAGVEKKNEEVSKNKTMKSVNGFGYKKNRVSDLVLL